MAGHATITTLLISVLLPALSLLPGCRRQGAPPPASPPTPRVASPQATIEIREDEPFRYRHGIANASEIAGGLVFKLVQGKLPEGCRLEESTGELQWTPNETHGPGSYRLPISCHPVGRPDLNGRFEVLLNVVEVNHAPSVTGPAEVSVIVGSTLDQPVSVADGDFPANRIGLELVSGPAGAIVDDIRRAVLWEVPESWQTPQVELVIAAQDDGSPPLRSVHRMLVNVTQRSESPPPAPEVSRSDDQYRLPEAAIELPPLPRPGDPLGRTPLPLPLDPPISTDDARISLLVPDELRSVLKVRYLGDQDTRLAVLLAEPFELDSLPGNLDTGMIATCEIVDSVLHWSWAMTKDLSARGYQNNVRQCVLVLESKGGDSPRLIALQKAVDVPAPVVEDLLGTDDLQVRLLRQDRVTKSVPLVGVQCTARIGDRETSLQSDVDGFSLVLHNQELLDLVNRRTGPAGGQFSRFGFRILQVSGEITLTLDADPSPADVLDKLRGTRKSLLSRLADHRQWQRKLVQAESSLRSAQRLPEENRVQRLAKATAINRANRSIQQARANLDRLAAEIPADENLVAKMEAAWKAMADQLQPVRTCLVCGEVWRRVADARVHVLRLVPVENQSSEKSEASAQAD